MVFVIPFGRMVCFLILLFDAMLFKRETLNVDFEIYEDGYWIKCELLPFHFSVAGRDGIRYACLLGNTFCYFTF